MKNMVRATLQLLLLAIVMLKPYYCQDADKDAKAIEEFLKKFYSARPFPLCLNRTKLPDSGLKPVEAITFLHQAVNFTDFKINRKSRDNKTNITTVSINEPIQRMPYKSIKLDRITVPVLKAYNLRQWMHITINFAGTILPASGSKSRIDFLIMQPVGSPLGLPFGEFRKDVNCLDDDKVVGVPKNVYFVPCSYRPRSAIRHPHVYVAYDPNGFTQLHVNFNYINSICQEMIAMQFLILYHVRGTKPVFKTAMTPVILLEKRDSNDGIPYPYYTGWEMKDVRCHGLNPNTKYPEEKAEPIPAKVDTCIYKVVYNDEFDKCIAEGTGAEADPSDRTCPPGPFYCQETLAVAAKKNKFVDVPGIVIAPTVEEYIKQLSKSWASCPFMDQGGVTGREDCYGPGRLYLTEICFRREHEYIDSDRIRFTLDRIGRNEHGLYMMHCLFFQTLSTYYSRFFKEAGKKGVIGIRFWLWAHFLLTFLSSLFMWLGVAKPKGSEFTSHGVIGVLALLMYHANIVIGFIRPIKEVTRMKLIITHTVLGYVSQLLITIAGLITSSCLSTKLFVIFSQIIMVGIYLAVTYAPLLMGEKIVQLRKLMPVPETLEIISFKKVMIFFAVLPWPIFLGMLISAVFNYRSYAISTDPDPHAECRI